MKQKVSYMDKEIYEKAKHLVELKDLYLEQQLNPADTEMFFDSIEELFNLIKDKGEYVEQKRN